MKRILQRLSLPARGVLRALRGGAAQGPQMDDLAAAVARVEWLAQALHPKIDNAWVEIAAIRQMAEEQRARLDGLTGESDRSAMAAEIDRLDGYIVYHADRVLAQLAEARSAEATPAQDRGQGMSILYSAPTVDAVLPIGGYDVVVPTGEAGLLAYLARHGSDRYEPAVRTTLRRHLQPGMVAIDAGANIGIHTLAMADAVGPAGRVVAFEPLPHLARAIRRSLLLNGFSGRAEVVEAALVEGPRALRFHASEHSPVSSLFAVAGGGTTTIEVSGLALDDQVQEGGRVDLCKLDVEGAEPLVWKGMRRIVADNPGIVLIMEWSASHFARSGEDAEQFIRAIQSAGFSAWVLDDMQPGAVVRLDPEHVAGLEAANVLFKR